MSVSKEIIDELRSLSTCNISDILDRMGIQNAVAPAMVSVIPGRRIVGPAVTLRMVPSKDPNVRLTRHWEVQEDVAKPGDVLVIDSGGRMDMSTWGGGHSLRAKMKGLEGLVLDGATRDAEENREFGWPIYVRGFCPATSSKRMETVCINEPVQIENIQIKPGDIVMADDSGIVSIPRDRIEEVLTLAKELGIGEKRLHELLKQGLTYAEARAKLASS